jgi:nuclear polyadenylated RNA-binding protein 3
MRGIDRAIRGAPGPVRGDSYDRFDARAGVSPRDSEFRGPLRARDDYRPGRSPSPPRVSYRSREDYGSARGYDYYDGRERRRSRSRSPYGRRENGRYRERSMSPKPRITDEDADLQIPRRDPREVPDAQIILMDELDRGFVAWVEGEMRARGIRTEVMLLSPRISLPAVIRRQILEGVLAVAQLTRRSQDTNKIPLQVFDRTGGANNVRFDEYQDLEPKIAAELVLRAKQTQALPIPTTYAQPQLAPQQTYQPPATTATAPNLANLVGQLDNATLQKLLGTLNAVAPAPQVTHAANPPLDLAGILGGLVQQQQQQQQQQQPPPPPPPQQQQRSAYQSQAPPANSYASLANNDNLASLLGSMPAQAQPQGQSAQQVQNIMAQLAKFRQ